MGVVNAIIAFCERGRFRVSSVREVSKWKLSWDLKNNFYRSWLTDTRWSELIKFRVYFTNNQFQNDSFREEDIGKVFQLSDNLGSGQIIEVSTISDLSSAVLDITVPFVKSSPNQGQIVTQAANGNGEVVIDISSKIIWSLFIHI